MFYSSDGNTLKGNGNSAIIHRCQIKTDTNLRFTFERLNQHLACSLHASQSRYHILLFWEDKKTNLSTTARASLNRAAKISPMKYSAKRPTAWSRELRSLREQWSRRQSFSAVMLSLRPERTTQSHHWTDRSTRGCGSHQETRSDSEDCILVPVVTMNCCKPMYTSRFSWRTGNLRGREERIKREAAKKTDTNNSVRCNIKLKTLGKHLTYKDF